MGYNFKMVRGKESFLLSKLFHDETCHERVFTLEELKQINREIEKETKEYLFANEADDNNIDSYLDYFSNRMNLTIIQEEDNATIIVYPFISVLIDREKNALTLALNPEFTKILFDFKKEHEGFSVWDLYKLKSQYTYKLAEFLLTEANTQGEVAIPLPDLKKQLGINEGKYRFYGHFKNKVLNVALEELNQSELIHVSYKEGTNGRKVEQIQFSIKTKLDEK